ncbi:MAG: hypothetical protein LBP19_02665 [Treponema sp.]|nr:hypothetical protein [Treponema sp.]
MSELTDYIKKLSEAIDARRDWLEKNEIPKLKEELRVFQTSYSVLYKAILKKGLINEDPYKQEAKVDEIQAPDTSNFLENEKNDKLTLRFADFDNQLDFLVNFYQYSVDFFTMDRIKRILELIKFIDWSHLTSNSMSINTHYMAEFINQVKSGLDSLTLSLINESTSNLVSTTGKVTASLKQLANFNRESYKLMARTAITANLPEGEIPTAAQIKKKFPQLLPGTAYYPDLIEEILKEDYSDSSKELREAVLKSFIIIAGKQKKEEETAAVSVKYILIEGIRALGSISRVLAEVALKLDENNNLFAHKRLTLREKFSRFINSLLNKEPESIIYELQYADRSGNRVMRKVNFNVLRADMDKWIKNLSPMGMDKASVTSKLAALQETQLMGFLEKNIRDMQSLHKTLSAMDEYFKTNIDKDDRSKVKGIKPELSTIKNAFIRANQKRCDYNAQKEEVEQFKKLGITVSKSDGEKGSV